MRRLSALFLFLLLFPFSPAGAADFQVAELPAEGDYVVLVHGLDWFRDTLRPTAEFLHERGYHTLNVRYPSRQVADIAEASAWVNRVIEDRCVDPRRRIHFVAHSMGAIVVRNLFTEPRPWRPGRVVLLGAPNQGTPLSVPLRRLKPLRKIMGPAAALLAPGEDTLPLRLGDASAFAPGVLMGSKAGRFAVFSPFLPGEDDGVIPVSSGKIAGMADFRVLPVSHVRMPRDPAVLAETLTFLQTGHFSQTVEAPAAKPPPSPATSPPEKRKRLLSSRQPPKTARSAPVFKPEHHFPLAVQVEVIPRLNFNELRVRTRHFQLEPLFLQLQLQTVAQLLDVPPLFVQLPEFLQLREKRHRQAGEPHQHDQRPREAADDGPDGLRFFKVFDRAGRRHKRRGPVKRRRFAAL